MNKYNIKELESKIAKCKNEKIENINKDKINKLLNIKIDRKKKGNDRILDFISKITNPYIFNVNGRIVKIEFSNNGKKAEDCITNVLSKLYQ